MMEWFLNIQTLIFIIFMPSVVFGQQINSLRSLDNNKALAEDTTDWKINRVIKNLQFRQYGNTILSFGGEVREQLRYYSNMSFGDVKTGTNDHDVFLLQRYMIHADFRLNKNLRLFGQLNSNHVWGKDNISPEVDRDDLGVMQAFVDL